MACWRTSSRGSKRDRLLPSPSASPTECINCGICVGDLTAVRLRELLHYDPLTGELTRRVAVANIHPGAVVGCVAVNGYLRGRVDGRLYYCHRLAWLYMTGEWPTAGIDHKDGNRASNCWVNLREATHAQNLQNISPTTRSLSGIRNVYFDKASGKWQVKLGIGSRSKSFGYFSTKEEAGEAAYAARRLTYSFHREVAQ